jgi:hypothetical protein
MVVAWCLLMLGLALAFTYRHALQSWWLAIRLKHQYSPLAIRAAVHGYQSIYLSGINAPLLRTLEARYLAPTAHVYSHLLLLAPIGGGKTTLLLRLYRRQLMPWRPWSSVLLLRAADPSTPDRIAQCQHRASTLLMLDGLDEDPLMAQAGRERLDYWLGLTRGFGKVLISCAPDYWPGALVRVAGGEAIRYTGDREVQLFACFAWTPAPAPHRGRPWLRGLQALDQPDPKRAPFQVTRLETRLRGLRAGSPHAPLQADRFWRAAALDMALQAAKGLGLSLSAQRLADLHTVHAPHWNLRHLTRDLLWRDSQKRYQFHHVALAAYFLSESDQAPSDSLMRMAWLGLPQAKGYRQERVWLALQAHPAQGQAWFRTRDQVTRRPLVEMQAQEALQVSRLYLPASLHEQAAALLPGLPELKGLYLFDADRQHLTADWLEALPHPEVMIYLMEGQARLREVWQYQPAEGEWQGAQNPLSVQAQGLEPVRLRARPAIAEPLPHPRGDCPDDRGIEAWLRAELGPQLDQASRWQGPMPHDVRLPQTAWGLFHRLWLWPGDAGRFNLMLEQTFPSTLLTSELRILVHHLVARLGEDDAHRQGLNPDDEAQLEDGFWTGRRWLWGNTDRYASPVRLSSERAGFATLEIWNVRLA